MSSVTRLCDATATSFHSWTRELHWLLLTERLSTRQLYIYVVMLRNAITV